MQIPSIGKTLPKPNISMKNVSEAFTNAKKFVINNAHDEFVFSKKVLNQGFLGATSSKKWENVLAAGAIMLSNVLQYSIGSFGESTESGKSQVKKFEKVKGLVLGTIGGACAGILTRANAPSGQAKRWVVHAAALGAVVDLACATVMPPIAEKLGKYIHGKKEEKKAANQDRASMKNDPKILEAQFEQDIQVVEIPIASTEIKR